MSTERHIRWVVKTIEARLVDVTSIQMRRISVTELLREAKRQCVLESVPELFRMSPEKAQAITDWLETSVDSLVKASRSRMRQDDKEQLTRALQARGIHCDPPLEDLRSPQDRVRIYRSQHGSTAA